MKIFILVFSYIAPFYRPFMWPFVWYAPPLTYILLRQQKKRLFLYISLLISIGHTASLAKALYNMAYGPLALKIIAPIAVVLYVTLFPLFFFTAFLALDRFCINRIQSIALWTIVMWLYSIVIDQYCLWPFGICEGIIFMNPLLPIASSPWMLWPLKYITLNTLLFLFFCLCNSLLIIGYRKWIILFCVYAGSSYLIYQPCQPPSWLSTIGHLPIQIPESAGSRGKLFLEYEVEHLLHTYPDLKTIIIPESGWYGTSIQDIDILCKKAENLLIGSFFEDQTESFNSLYHFQKGFLQSRIDKKHAVPLTERSILPQSLKNLFFMHSKPINPSKKTRVSIPLIPHVKIAPYICSELFCNHTPIDFYDDPIIAVANDTWFCKQFRLLMALAARLRSIQWQRHILYISYYYAHFFDPSGGSYTLPTHSHDSLL